MAETNRVERWLSLAGNIVAPVTVLSALLFYFGYASTRAKYEYFGVDVDIVGLGTRDYLMRSASPLLVPIVMLGVAALLAVWLNSAVRAVLTERTGRQDHLRRLELLRKAATATLAVGSLVLGAGVVLVVLYPRLIDWPAYDMVTPLCLAGGTVLATYGRHVKTKTAPGTDAPAQPGADLRRKQVTWALCAAIVAGSLFWATSTLAQWSGRGQAITLADHFGDLPRVILDTKENLDPRSPFVTVTEIQSARLDPPAPQTFRYRYRGLRLLIEGDGRMFLVPDKWSNAGTTYVVPLDTSVRVRFQFENPLTDTP